MSKNVKRQGRQSVAMAEQTRNQIILRAIELFADKGFDGTSLRDIAEHANVTHGTLRHHFGNKLALWKAAADKVIQHYQERQMPVILAASDSGNPLQSLQSIVRGFIRVSYENPLFAKMLMGESSSSNGCSDYVEQRFLDMHHLIEALFNQARQQSSQLEKFTNDSFFLTLLSLTFLPLVLPQVGRVLSSPTEMTPSAREAFILAILFGDKD